MRLLQFCVGLLAVGSISGCSETFEEIIWVDQDFAPEITDQTYICRGKIDGIVLIGSYVPGEKRVCLVNHKNRAVELKLFKVLECAASGIWTPLWGNILPSNIYSFDGSRPLHACRYMDKNQTIGVVRNVICSEEDDLSCVEKVVCDVLELKNKKYRRVELDKFTIFSTTNTMVETDIDKGSKTYDLVDPLQIRSLSFNVKASQQVALFFKPDPKTTLFEILIGGLDNSITAIRKGGYIMYSNTTHTMSVLEVDSYVSFWVSWGKGSLTIGRADKYLMPRVASTKPVISLKDSGVFGINKYSVKSASPTAWSFFF